MLFCKALFVFILESLQDHNQSESNRLKSSNEVSILPKLSLFPINACLKC